MSCSLRCLAGQPVQSPTSLPAEGSPLPKAPDRHHFFWFKSGPPLFAVCTTVSLPLFDTVSLPSSNSLARIPFLTLHSLSLSRNTVKVDVCLCGGVRGRGREGGRESEWVMCSVLICQARATVGAREDEIPADIFLFLMILFLLLLRPASLHPSVGPCVVRSVCLFD